MRKRTKGFTASDFCVSWAKIGSSTKRLSFIGWSLADLAREAIEKGELEEPDVVSGVEASGIPLGLIVAEELEKPFAVVRARPHAQKALGALKKKVGNAISVSFAPVEGKRVLIVEDVISTGETLSAVIKALRKVKAKPIGVMIFIDKKAQDKIEGVPVKALVKVMPIMT